MPNNCDMTLYVSRLTKKNKDKLVSRLNENDKSEGIAERLIPYSKEVRDDLEMEHECHKMEREIRERYKPLIEKDESKTQEMIKELDKVREEHPYKQLWYHWQIENWWQKWWLCDVSVHESWDDSIEVYWWTPWWPEYPVIQKMSEVFECKIYYEYSEPGMWFSWQVEYINWIEENESYRDDDAYFWEGERCDKCWCCYDWRCDDDWYINTPEKHVCAWCDIKEEEMKQEALK